MGGGGGGGGAAILGVALSLALQISVFAGALAVALVMALTVTVLSERGYAMDTLLGVLAHSALAFGLCRRVVPVGHPDRPHGLSLRRYPRRVADGPRGDLGRCGGWSWG